MAPNDLRPKSEENRPPGLARWMVKHSLQSRVREESIAAFEDEFADDYAQSGDLPAARRKAYRAGWDALHSTYKPLIDICGYVLAILGVVLAIVAVL